MKFHYYILFTVSTHLHKGEDQLFKCANEKKVLITFMSLEGALSLKIKGYNPVFVLVLPNDLTLYKKNMYQSLEKYTNQNISSTKNVPKY